MTVVTTDFKEPVPEWHEGVLYNEIHNEDEARDSSFIEEEKKDDTSAMSSNQKHILAERSIGKFPSSATKASSRRKKKRLIGNVELLKELDETVASVGKLYHSTRRPEDDDSEASHSIATQEGHSIYAHRNLIDNMHVMTGDSQSVRSSQSKSKLSRASQHKSRASRSKSRSSRSINRCKRGDSLERDIASILQTEAKNFDTNTHPQEQELDYYIEATTDYILQDLCQVSTVMYCEIQSSDCSLDSVRRRIKFNPLLTPIESESNRSEQESEKDEDNEASEDEEETPSFAKLNDLDFLTANTSIETPLSEATNPDGAFPVDPFESSILETSKWRDSFIDSDEWTTFAENPFDTVSVESPSSIAEFSQSHFTKVRTWKTSEHGWKNMQVSML